MTDTNGGIGVAWSVKDHDVVEFSGVLRDLGHPKLFKCSPLTHTMGFSSDRALTLVGVVSAVILLSSLTYEFLLHDEEEVVFAVDDLGMMEDVASIASFGPRVAGSVEESLATDYISQRFTEIGLENVKVEEFQVTGAWFVDAEPEDHQILMHAQLEQGVQNVLAYRMGRRARGGLQLMKREN